VSTQFCWLRALRCAIARRDPLMLLCAQTTTAPSGPSDTSRRPHKNDSIDLSAPRQAPCCPCSARPSSGTRPPWVVSCPPCPLPAPGARSAPAPWAYDRLRSTRRASVRRGLRRSSGRGRCGGQGWRCGGPGWEGRAAEGRAAEGRAAEGRAGAAEARAYSDSSRRSSPRTASAASPPPRRLAPQPRAAPCACRGACG